MDAADAVRAKRRSLTRVISPRELRLLFWLIVIALVGIIALLGSGVAETLSGPAVILFVAWLMAYVLEPPVTWLAEHLPFHSRGLAVAVTYVITVIVTLSVILSVGAAVLNAAVGFVEQLPTIVARVEELVQPLAASMGLTPPAPVDLAAAIGDQVASNGEAIANAITAAMRDIVGLIAGLFTAIVISVGMAAGEVTLLGWLRRFLPERSYADIAALERAIAVSFGGFIRGRGLIGAIFGSAVGIAAVVLGIPFAPLIGLIAGLLQFVPFLGPLLGWAVLPSFALIVAPTMVVPALVVSLLIAGLMQLIVTRMVMGRAVKISAAAVLAVVMIGTAIAGILGAVFAIPTTAAILSITDYLRKRDVLLRADVEEVDAGDTATRPPGESAPMATS